MTATVSAPAVPGVSLYDLAGGPAAVRLLAQSLQGHLVADVVLGRYVTIPGRDELYRRLLRLGNALLRADPRRSGRVVSVAIARLNLPDSGYRRFCLYIIGSLYELQVPMDAILTVEAELAAHAPAQPGLHVLADGSSRTAAERPATADSTRPYTAPADNL
jgi:hypothetical protein